MDTLGKKLLARSGLPVYEYRGIVICGLFRLFHHLCKPRVLSVYIVECVFSYAFGRFCFLRLRPLHCSFSEFKESVRHLPDACYILCHFKSSYRLAVYYYRNSTVNRCDFLAIKVLVGLLLLQCGLIFLQGFEHGTFAHAEVRKGFMKLFTHNIAYIDLFHIGHGFVIVNANAVSVYYVYTFVNEFYELIQYFSVMLCSHTISTAFP